MAWTFFIPFILVATFTMLNLFIGVIVSAMQSFTASDVDTATALEACGKSGAGSAEPHAAAGNPHAGFETGLQAEMRVLRAELTELKTLLQANVAAAGPQQS